MAKRTSVGFSASLVAGHGGVTVVIVPFDPRELWRREPVALDARREGWLVAGTVNGVAFEGWIGFRWGRFFLMVDPALRSAAAVAVGDLVEVTVSPTTTATALAVAREQAKLTTAPRKRPSRAEGPEGVKRPEGVKPRAGGVKRRAGRVKRADGAKRAGSAKTAKRAT
jgi:hypothetical protein